MKKSFLFSIRWMMLGGLLAVTAGWAGTTGKIAGKAIDAETGDPMIGANVIVEGTVLGTASNMEGEYVILNVPPGTYTLRVDMIGYQSVRVQNLVVSVDLTTTIDVRMTQTVVDAGETVTIVAERPMVVKDLTASTAVVGADEIKSMPVTEISEAIELQAGLVKDAGGGLHVRGGRKGEVSYWIDGIPVTDVYDGGTVVDVNKDMVQELQVISGAFNAEYGQAMSGIVNITTKEGNNDFGGTFTLYSGDYVSNHTSIFPHIDEIHAFDIRNAEGSLYGPIIKDKLFYSVNARGIHFSGWQYGTRMFNPGAVVTYPQVDQEYLDEYLPAYSNAGNDIGNGMREFPYILGSDPNVDSLYVYSMLSSDFLAQYPDSFSYYYDRYMDLHGDGAGDGKAVAMNGNRKIYGQAKIIYLPKPNLKISYNFIYDDLKYRDYDRNYILNPDGDLTRYNLGRTHILQFTHTLSAKTFYKFGFSNFSKHYWQATYNDAHDARYVHPDLGLQNPYTFKTAGTNMNRLNRYTSTSLAKLDITSQVTSIHQVKAGLEARRYDLYYRSVDLQPVADQISMDFLWDGPYIQTRIMPDSTIYASRYSHKPIEYSAYLQDKIELNNMIINAGIRIDYFDPDGKVLTDGTDPNIYNPIKPSNRYHDYGSDGIPNTYDSDGTEGNGLQDPGETSITLAERKTYWYKNATEKIQVSPRLGVSFPITERGIIHFSYGHFFQIPRFERLYQNPDFDLGTGTGNVGVIGNANLKPEYTVSGEIGLQQQLSDDISLHVTAYFRDIRNLAGTRADEIVIFGGASKYSKFANSDFGFIRGVILALNKRFSNNFSGAVDYTFQIARGTNSDPEQARNALSNGEQPEVQLTALDWDQMHTVNGSFSYGMNNWGLSLIGQWGSGLPYTPRTSTDITTLLTNSQIKPPTYNVDLRAYYDYKVPMGTMTFFLRVFNLFDTENQVNVFDDTGKAGKTRDLDLALSSNPTEYINTIKQWFTNATHYSEPRRVEVGMTLSF